MEALLEQFRAVAADPGAYLRRRRREDGLRVVGFLCTYVQEELLHAGGFLPARLFGYGGKIALADSHLGSFSCAFVRGCLEAALRQDLDYVDAVVFPRTCDMIRALEEIWGSADARPHYAINTPLVLSAPGAHDFLLGELRAFQAWIEEQGGTRITAPRLAASLALYHRQRLLLERLYELRRADAIDVSSADAYAIMKSGMIMPRDEHADLLEKLLAAARPVMRDDFIRVVLEGDVCTGPTVAELIDRLGGRVVDDNLCVGRRYFADSLPPGDAPPLATLARRTLTRAPCPCKHVDVNRRADDLVALVRRSDARGVVFLLQHFCHPHYFDQPHLHARLDRESIPHLVLDIGEQASGLGRQAETRLQAFLEMLQ
jgi:bcr-type benzoyl-CoA reductase subunit C